MGGVIDCGGVYCLWEGRPVTPPSGAIVRRLVLSVFQSRSDASGRGLYFGKSEGVPREARTLKKKFAGLLRFLFILSLKCHFVRGEVYCFRGGLALASFRIGRKTMFSISFTT